jgi:hypothetical protein
VSSCRNKLRTPRTSKIDFRTSTEIAALDEPARLYPWAAKTALVEPACAQSATKLSPTLCLVSSPRPERSLSRAAFAPAVSCLEHGDSHSSRQQAIAAVWRSASHTAIPPPGRSSSANDRCVGPLRATPNSTLSLRKQEKTISMNVGL